MVPSSRILLGLFLLTLCMVALTNQGHAGQEDPFYAHLLRQQMMIAKIRELRGEIPLESRFPSVPDNTLKKETKGSSKSSSSICEGGMANPRPQKCYPREYEVLISKAAERLSLPPSLIKAVIHAESNFVPNAISHAGARGLMQLMPQTAIEIGVYDPFSPGENIWGGSRLLKSHLEEFRSIKKALIAYNAGAERVRKGQKIPTETRIYIERVLYFYQIYKQEGG